MSRNGYFRKKRQQQKKSLLMVCAACLCIAAIALGVGIYTNRDAIFPSKPAVSAPAASSVQQAEATPVPTPEPQPIISTVRMSATGDDLIHDGIFKQAAKRSAEPGHYDFDYVYENVRSFYGQFDLNWLNQETLVTDAFEPDGYPCFATPTDIFKSLYSVGWRAFNVSTNHSYDKWATGIRSSMEFWDSTPDDVAVSGFYNLETYDNYTYQTVNGIKFGYLSYTYGTNGINTPKDTDFGVVYTDQLDIIEKQVTDIRPNCDVLVVSCHWGTEGSHIIHDSQPTLAQQLADWGADLIIGTHPHVVQDCAWLTAADGHKVFVAYSLGNFINFQDRANNMVGGVLDITIQKTEEPDGTVTIDLLDPKIHGVVSHYDSHFNNGRVYMLEDYTEELANSHGVRAYDSRFNLDFCRQVLADNISEEFLA